MNTLSTLALAALALLCLASCTDNTKTAEGGTGKAGMHGGDSHIQATPFSTADVSADSFVALASSGSIRGSMLVRRIGASIVGAVTGSRSAGRHRLEPSGFRQDLGATRPPRRWIQLHSVL